MPSREYEKFAELLERYLKVAKRSPSWLAGELKLRISTVTKWLNNKTRPGEPETVDRIATIFNLNALQREELFKAAGYSYHIQVIAPAEPFIPQKAANESYQDPSPRLNTTRQPVLPPSFKPFLRFHEDLIEDLCARLSFTTYSDHQIIVLQGPRGMGKSHITEKVDYVLKQNQGEIVIYHSVGHMAEREKPADALDSFFATLCSDLGIPTTDSPKVQRKKILDAARSYRCKIIVDGVRREIEEVFIDFLEPLSRSAKILMTHTSRIACQHSAQDYKIIELPGITKERMPEFLAICGLEIALAPEDLEKIRDKTAGNSFALREIARSLKAKPKQVLGNLLKNLTHPGGPADGWVGATFKDLREEEQALLCAYSLFRNTVDQRIPVEIAWAYLERSKPPQKEVDRLFNRLREMGVLAIGEKPERARMNEPYLTYIWKMIDDDPELKRAWKRKWVGYYAQLRPRKSIHDEAGWTIFTDYHPDEGIPINYTDEIGTIVDVIRYCVSKDHVHDYWMIGAALLDNFRAMLFATGRWNARINLCQRIIKEAKDRDEVHVEGKVGRLLAWMYCFQDRYQESARQAKRARRIAYNGIQNKGSSVEDRITHRQTYYKSLNTLGQIALRKGQDAAIRLQIARRQRDAVNQSEPEYARQLDEKVQTYLRQAQDHLKEAREFFLRADGFVGAEFPPETLMTEFHIAEVDYYQRHLYGLPGAEIQLKESLAMSLTAFQKILDEATKKQHKRMKAHAHYYLGKVYRRLTRHPNEEPQSVYFDNALSHLREALNLSGKFGDSVLTARTEFALSQWHDEKASATESDVEEAEYKMLARRLAHQAAKALKGFGMAMESADAVAFLQRLGETTIPMDLLELLDERYAEVTARP